MGSLTISDILVHNIATSTELIMRTQMGSLTVSNMLDLRTCPTVAAAAAELVLLDLRVTVDITLVTIFVYSDLSVWSLKI